MTEAPLVGQRLDKWLWAARFFKTRRLASEAIGGGKVRVDGQRCKPSRLLRPGARVRIHRNGLDWEIEVLALTARRGPATEAALLYREDEASRLHRQELVRARRAATAQCQPVPAGRPTKRDRRRMEQFAHQAADVWRTEDGHG